MCPVWLVRMAVGPPALWSQIGRPGATEDASEVTQIRVGRSPQLILERGEDDRDVGVGEDGMKRRAILTHHQLGHRVPTPSASR